MHFRQCTDAVSYDAGVIAVAPTPSGMPAPDPAAIGALVPQELLRAGINLSNFLLVSGTGDNGEPVGLSPSLASALAAALGVPVELVSFAGPSELVDALVADELDVGNIGADPARAGHVAFTGPYCEIEATYLVRAESPITSIDQVDCSGVRIASRRGAAYTLWLDRNIAHAELIHTDTVEDGFEVFVSEGLEVLAGLRPRLIEDAVRIPGSRLLEDRFTAVQQSIGTHRGRGVGALTYLERFVDWAIRSGFVAAMIQHYAVKGLSVSAARPISPIRP
jgi:polar amino acid transport system substrate-binding protein